MSRSNKIDDDGGAFSGYFCYNKQIKKVENSENKRFIYKITSPSNSVYIGQSVNVNERISKYRILDCKKQPAIFGSLLKYGFSNHDIEMIDMASDQDTLCEKEIYWISYYKNSGHEMLNLNNGGRANIGYKRISTLGSPRTEITKEKLRRANLGKKLSAEHKLKISLSNKGKKIDPDHLKKFHEAQRKHTRYNAEKYNCSIACSVPVYCHDNDTHYASATEAGKQLNIKGTSILSGLRRGQLITCGYRFSYSNKPKTFYQINK